MYFPKIQTRLNVCSMLRPVAIRSHFTSSCAERTDHLFGSMSKGLRYTTRQAYSGESWARSAFQNRNHRSQKVVNERNGQFSSVDSVYRRLPVIQECLESIHISRLTVLDAPAEATVIRVTKYLTLHPSVRSMLLPHGKRLLHTRIGKEFHANLALDRPSHHTLQVGPPGDLFRRDTNL